jgi:CRISPR-associated endonuclease Cas1 subtype II
MTWRVVIITKVSKLDLKLNTLVIRGDGITRIHLSEIATLVLESTAISITAALLCELNKRGIKIIFCDEKRNPYGELVSYYGSHDATEKMRCQIAWDKEIIGIIWAEIVRDKITKQSQILEENGRFEGAAHILSFADNVQPNDASNREGHAAKVYFNSLFGKGFSRDNDDSINACLNYGYTILLSAFNREISIAGYYTQLGIFHDNTFNPFNLGSDLMEPFRPLIDRHVIKMNPVELTPESKKGLVDVLNQEVMIDGKRNFLLNAMRIYCRSVFDAINERDVGLLRFYE